MAEQHDWRRRFVKKEYKKPLVAVEHFSMVYTSARDCMDNIDQERLTLSDKSNCGWSLGDGTIVFIPSDIFRSQACNLDGTIFEGNLEDMEVCYNNPAEGQYIFRS